MLILSVISAKEDVNPQVSKFALLLPDKEIPARTIVSSCLVDCGDAWGMFELGECYEKGTGVKKDPDAAYLWFCRAALAAPEDKNLYERVQNQVFSPELKKALGR